MQGPATFGVDCLNLLRNIKQVVSGTAADDGKDEDFSALVDLLRRSAHPTELQKVKAHTKARHGLGDTPEGNRMADTLADKAVKEQRPPVPPFAPRAPRNAGPPVAIPLVKQSDDQPMKRDALAAFALEHILDEREAKRSRRSGAAGQSICQNWQGIQKEATLRADVMTPIARLKKVSHRAKRIVMRARCRAYFPGKNQPCPCCGKQVTYSAHWRLSCPAGGNFSTEAHNKLVLRVAQAITRSANPPTYMFVNAGSKERPSEWTVPSELLPHLPPPAQRGFCDTPDIMCVRVRNVFGVPAWAGPGTPVLHPQGITLLPIEVAVTYDLTYTQADLTPLGTPEDERPHGGLVTTMETKAEKYFTLMHTLAACGFDVQGEPVPVPAGQEDGELPDNTLNHRVCYPFWFATPQGRRIEVPKIWTIVLGVMGSIPDAAVRAAQAAGIHDPALWADLSAQLANDFCGSFSIFYSARRAGAGPSSSLPHAQQQSVVPPAGVG